MLKIVNANSRYVGRLRLARAPTGHYRSFNASYGTHPGSSNGSSSSFAKFAAYGGLGGAFALAVNSFFADFPCDVVRKDTICKTPSRTMSTKTYTYTCATTPDEILTFWYGPDMWGTEKMDQMQYFGAKIPMWFGIKPDFSTSISPEESRQVDESCQQFVEAIQACGDGQFEGAGVWNSTKGLFAQMLLCDQLTRNCFRRTDQAFAFDKKGMEVTRKLYASGVWKDFQKAQFQFFVVPGQHSEELKDHEMNDKIVEFMTEKYGKDDQLVRICAKYVSEHKDLIVRFGRYPHRNESLGRENTEEEEKWLADYDNLPGFAKSQMKKKE